MLVQALTNAAATGSVAPTSHLATARTYLERGSLDTVYMDGSVNRTRDLFLHFAGNASQVFFVAHIPHQHAQLTADPWLSTDSCGGSPQPWAPPAMQNCGNDAAGAALQHIYEESLRRPSSLAFQHPENLFQFDQTPYFPAAWPGLSSIGYVYIPTACQPGGNATTCKLHVALHGCGMSIWSPQMNTSFVEHTGFNAWADANDMVVLYPQSGGFLEQGLQAPTAQLQAGCFDSYGQTSVEYAFRTGLQMLSIRQMIEGIAAL